MSGTETITDQLSRPQFQRTELGPVLHAYSHYFFDNIDFKIPDISMEALDHTYEFIEEHKLESNFSFIEYLYKVKPLVLRELNNQFYEQASCNFGSLDNLIENYTLDKSSNLSSYTINETGFTYNNTAREVLYEGISSGLTMPIQLWRMISLTESGYSTISSAKYWGLEKQELTEIANRFRDPEFQKMLHFLSYNYNGSLGTISLEITYILPEDVSLPRPYDFLLNNSNKVVDFTDEYKDKQLESVRAHNKKARDFNTSIDPKLERLAISVAESGGCPVRHSTFKKLGEVASIFYEEFPKFKEYLERDESAITRSCRFLASVLEQAVVIYDQEYK